jgi:ankyrin repeat protein
MYDRAAGRLLRQYPEIARASLYSAIVCGERQEVERILAERPEAPREPGGSRGWPPLLYLCFTRFTNSQTSANAVAIARVLLDSGADPNAFYMAGDSRYTALVGIAGEGEQDSPRQPQARELFQPLLEHGAAPFDIQVLYNTHFSGDMLWWLTPVYAYTVNHGRQTAWEDPSWSMLDMGGYGPGAYFVLNAALERNDVTLAEWVLAHGASPNITTSHHPKFKPEHILLDRAMVEGLDEMAALLARYEARRGPRPLTDEQRFVAACLRLDREAVLVEIEQHPEYLRSPAAIFAAARRDRADVVAFLLGLGVPLEIEDTAKQRALHVAAGYDALQVAKLLVDRGAEIDPIENNWGATPLGIAAYGDREEMRDFLSRFSKDVWTLSSGGYLDRLADVLAAEPKLATLVAGNGITPLWLLPEDAARALEIVEVFLGYGADPTLRDRNGKTAADWALERGMRDVARRLGSRGAAEPLLTATPDLEHYESLARDLLFAFESGHAAAMDRLKQAYEIVFTWEELRASVRQRLDAVPASERPDGYFGLPHARLLVARKAGFENWAALLANAGREARSKN